VITPEKAERFLEKLSIEKFFGVGKVTAQRMHELGIKNGFDLKQYDEAELVRHFGKMGSMYYQFVRGIDEREVESEYVRKSLGTEETFAEDLYEMVDLLRALNDIAKEVHRRADKRNFLAKTLTLKIKYADFTVITRSKTVEYYLRTYDHLFDLGKELLLQVDDIEDRKIRLMGLTLKNAESDTTLLANLPVQLTLDFKDED
jgi:DNA polymerase-4